jgi:hypothetical protein
MALFSGPTLLWVLVPFPSLIFLPPILKLGALFLIRVSLICTLRLSSFSLNLINLFKKSFYFLGRIWFLPNLSGQVTSNAPMQLGRNLIKTLDQGWLEYSVSLVSSNVPSKLNQLILVIQNNRLKTHFLIFILWTFLLLWL